MLQFVYVLFIVVYSSPTVWVKKTIHLIFCDNFGKRRQIFNERFRFLVHVRYTWVLHISRTKYWRLPHICFKNLPYAGIACFCDALGRRR